MISLVTGIVSDSLMTSQQVFKRNKLVAMSQKRKEMTEGLTDFLHDLLEDEVDAYGRVDSAHLKMAVRGDTDLQSNLAHVGINIGEMGILELIDKLSNDGDDVVNLDFFAKKLINLRGGAEASAMVDLKYELIMTQQKLEALSSKRFPDLPPLLTPKKSAKEEVQEAAHRNSVNNAYGAASMCPQESILKGAKAPGPPKKRNSQIRFCEL